MSLFFQQNQQIKYENSKVPNHKKVESNKKAQQSSAVSNKGGGGVSDLLIFNDDLGAGEHKIENCGVHLSVGLEGLNCYLQLIVQFNI